MRLVSFDAYQAINIPGVRVIKPENWFREKAVIESADWVLFPEYWQVNPLVYGLKKRIFPSVSSYHIGHDKVEMARAFEAVCPLNCPNTRILANTERSMEQILDEYDFPFVAKTIRSARGEGVFLIGDRADFRKYAEKNEVLFIQEYLPIYRDLRVIVIGRQIVTAYWRQAREGCFHNNISRGGEVSFENIPDSALQLVNHVAETLGINYAGFDVAEVNGHCFLLEFNLRFGTQALYDRHIRLGQMVFDYLSVIHQPPVEPHRPRFPRAG